MTEQLTLITPIRLIIADDHHLFTQGLKTILESYPFIELCGIVHDGRELLSIIEHDSEFIILLDINMPGLNGLDAAAKISQRSPAIKMIILSMYDEGYIMQKAKDFGCKGYVVKTTDTKELIDAIICVHQGGEYFNDFNSRIREEPFKDHIASKFKLTRRELEILNLLKQEMTNKEISEKLFLSIYTVETHRKNIMQKLNLKTPAALIKFFVQNENC